MAKIRIFYGAAGCGKTFRAVNDFYEASKRNDPLFPEKRCFLIVPEQLTVETERKLFEKNVNGVIDSEVISFGRLVHRIIKDSDRKTPDPITPTMRTMLLVKALSRLEKESKAETADGHEDSGAGAASGNSGKKLICFESVFDHPSAVSSLTTTLSELDKYSVSPEMLEKASNLRLASDPDDYLTGRRLSELAVILRSFKEETSGYADGAALAGTAIDIISSGNSIIKNACLFFDSFTGFTEVEMQLIAAMAAQAAEVSFYIFRDKANPVFAIPNETFDSLTGMFRGCETEVSEIVPEAPSVTKYSNSKMLFRLSRAYGKREKAPDADNDGSVRITAAVDLYHEMQACAERIGELVSDSGGYTYSDIAVAIPSVKDCSYILDGIFREHGIPCFIDAKTEYSGHRIIRFTDSFLKILRDERTVDNIMVMLRTGLYKGGKASGSGLEPAFTRDDVDTFENRLMQFACDKKQSWESFERFAGSAAKSCKPAAGGDGADSQEDGPAIPEITEEPGFLRLAKDILETFRGEEGFCVRARSCRTVNDVLELIASFGVCCGLTDEAVTGSREKGGTPEEREYVRVRNAFIDILNECSEVLGNVRKKGYKVLTEFTEEVLMSASSSIRAASIPFSGDYVQIGDIERSGYVDKKVIMVLGANDGSFPGNVPDSSFLGDSERDAISEAGGKTAFNSLKRALLSQFNVYKILTSPREKLYISYSLTDGRNEEKQPASAVDSLKRIFTKLKTEYCAAAEVLTPDIAEILPDGIDVTPGNVKKMLGITDSFRIGATALDDYPRCGFKYYLNYCLGLSTRDTGDAGYDIYGSYAHYLLEKAVAKASAENRLDCEDEKVWKEYVNDADREFRDDPDNLSKVIDLGNSNKDTLLSEITRAAVSRDLLNLASITSGEGSRPVFFELRIGTQGKGPYIPPFETNVDGLKVNVTGKVDRGDALTEGGIASVTILDYKSRDHSVSDVTDCVKIQLPVYALAISAKRARETMLQILGAGTEKYSVTDLRYYIYGDQAEKKDQYNNNVSHIMRSVDLKEYPELTEDGGASTTENEIKKRVGSILKGDFRKAEKKYEKDCKYCDYRSICKTFYREDN